MYVYNIITTHACKWKDSSGLVSLQKHLQLQQRRFSSSKHKLKSLIKLYYYDFLKSFLGSRSLGSFRDCLVITRPKCGAGICCDVKPSILRATTKPSPWQLSELHLLMKVRRCGWKLQGEVRQVDVLVQLLLSRWSCQHKHGDLWGSKVKMFTVTVTSCLCECSLSVSLSHCDLTKHSATSCMRLIQWIHCNCMEALETLCFKPSSIHTDAVLFSSCGAIIIPF